VSSANLLCAKVSTYRYSRRSAINKKNDMLLRRTVERNRCGILPILRACSAGTCR